MTASLRLAAVGLAAMVAGIVLGVTLASGLLAGAAVALVLCGAGVVAYAEYVIEPRSQMKRARR